MVVSREDPHLRLLGIQCLQRFGNRLEPAIWISDHGEFSIPDRSDQYRRFLEALAHDAGGLVPIVCVHADAGNHSATIPGDLCQFPHHRALARRHDAMASLGNVSCDGHCRPLDLAPNNSTTTGESSRRLVVDLDRLVGDINVRLGGVQLHLHISRSYVLG